MRWILPFVLLASELLAQGGPPPAKVVLDDVKSEVLENLRQVTGELRPWRVSVLAAEAEGIVLEAPFEEGDMVEAGAPVLTLEDTLAQLDMRQAGAEITVRESLLEQAHAEVEKAERDLKRAEKLAAQSVTSETVRDDAQTALRTARARVTQRETEITAARLVLEEAEEQLADRRLTAPFGGTVLSKRTEVGQWVRAGDPILEIVDLSKVELWIDVPEHLLERLLEPDTNVRVRVPALGLELESPITRIIPRADPLSRLFPVRIVLDNADGRLRPGMSVVGLVPTGRSDAVLTIHKDAVRRDDAGEFVYFDAGGTAMVMRITTLYAAGERLAVRGGLQEGMRVIVEGNERVFPGQPLVEMGAAPEGK